MHLTCNAHLDPIWQWTWDEGISATLSTFQTAAELADEFDYVFCHNESVLHEQVERLDPVLFGKIKSLVAAGKWHIMGGWYVQPDCNMPSGESILRQIKTGMKYFSDKFGAAPTTAINFDPFGHNIGIVQIMAACGQDSYMVCRPNKNQFDYPSHVFTWRAPDGSSVKVAQAPSYNSPLGHSAEKIREALKDGADDIDFVLWGVGNHGGGPSRKDLADIKELIQNNREAEIVHSTPEKFFAECKPRGSVERSLNACMPGCYSSMAKVKQAHRATENLLYATEQMHAVAALNGTDGGMGELKSAEKKLLLSQFHDILPGSCVKSGEENGLRLLYSAREELENLRTRAFFGLLKKQAKAKDGEYPVFAFNYMPYEVDTEIEAEFNLADQGWGDVTEVEVYGEDGKKIESQLIKESSTIALDWRKRVIFRAKLKPLSLTRFSLFSGSAANKKKCGKTPCEADVIKKYSGGLLSHPVVLKMYDDTADPWAMTDRELKEVGGNGCEFTPMTQDEAREFCAAAEVEPFECIESGPVMRAYESFSKFGRTRARTEYRFYEGLPYADINVDIEFAEKNRLARLFIPCPDELKRA